MKICHLVPTLDPKSGGPPLVALGLATAQARQGHEVHLLSCEQPDAIARVEQLLARTPGSDAVRIHALPTPGRLAQALGRPAVRWLSEHANELDFMHVHTTWWPALLRCGGVAQKHKLAFALTPHGMLDPWSLGQTPLKKWKKKIALALGYRKMFNRAAFIHALNTDEARLMQPLKLTPPFEVIPNGVDLAGLEPMPEPGAFRAKHPELGDAPYFLFISRVHYKKGLDILAEAAAKHARSGGQWHTVVAGPDDGAGEDLRQRIDRHKLNDRVHVVGPIYGPDKLAAINDAAAFILPSRQEGFSMAITEALACGLPVICTENCHYPEVAEVGAGRVVDLDIDKVAEAMIGFEQSPQSLPAMGEHGAKLVRDRLTWDRIAERAVTIYAKYTQ